MIESLAVEAKREVYQPTCEEFFQSLLHAYYKQERAPFFLLTRLTFLFVKTLLVRQYALYGQGLVN